MYNYYYCFYNDIRFQHLRLLSFYTNHVYMNKYDNLYFKIIYIIMLKSKLNSKLFTILI